MIEKVYGAAEIARLLQVQTFVVDRWLSRGYLGQRNAETDPERVSFEELVVFLRERRSTVLQKPASEVPTWLVVDDLEPVLNAIYRLSQRLTPRPQVLTVRSGYDAVVVALAHHCDLVLMDLHLPGIDGLQACARIRDELGDTSTRIVMMTAALEPGLQALCERAGADACVAKPCSVEELRSLAS